MKKWLPLMFVALVLSACFDGTPSIEDLMGDQELREKTAKLCARNLDANTNKENQYYETCKNLRHAVMECVFGGCSSAK